MRKPYFNRRLISEFQVRWILGKLHVSISAVGVVREFYRRTTKGIASSGWTRVLRKQVYRLALWQWAKDRELYAFVVRGGR